MGDSMREVLARGATDSSEFKTLRRAVMKARGDRAQAFRLVAHEMGLRPDALPLSVCRVIDAMLDRRRR